MRLQLIISKTLLTMSSEEAILTVIRMRDKGPAEIRDKALVLYGWGNISCCNLTLQSVKQDVPRIVQTQHIMEMRISSASGDGLKYSANSFFLSAPD